MKNILLLGATGTAGSAITEKLLSDTDYHVTLFSRHARDVFSDSSRMTVINGNAENREDLKKAMHEQDVVYCAISGEALPQIAKNIVAVMSECDTKRLIFMGAVGIYNEIPNEIDGEDNLDNEPAQLPNRQAVDCSGSKQFELYDYSPRLSERGRGKRFCPVRKGRTGERIYYSDSISCEICSTAYCRRKFVFEGKR